MTTELTVREPLVPDFVVTSDTIQRRIKELQEFVGSYMVEGEDFGVIPGTAKPTLLKPGAEKLCDVYGFQRLFEVTQRVEDWDRPLFHYEVRADLVDARSGLTVAQGMGSANSMEGRYRWRNAQRVCPGCHQEAIIKGKDEYGGGWLCFKRKGGCGAKYDEGDAQITDQQTGKVENDDIFTLVNTLLKMAKKRALVDAVLSATRSSGLFTQDVEDFVPPESPLNGDGEHKEPAAQPRQTRPQASPVTRPGDDLRERKASDATKPQAMSAPAEPADTPWATKLRELQQTKGLSIPQILDLLEVSDVGADNPADAMRNHLAALRMRHDWDSEQAFKDVHDRIIEALKKEGEDAPIDKSPIDQAELDEWEQTVADGERTAEGEAAAASDDNPAGAGDAAPPKPKAAARK